VYAGRGGNEEGYDTPSASSTLHTPQPAPPPTSHSHLHLHPYSTPPHTHTHTVSLSCKIKAKIIQPRILGTLIISVCCSVCCSVCSRVRDIPLAAHQFSNNLFSRLPQTKVRVSRYERQRMHSPALIACNYKQELVVSR